MIEYTEKSTMFSKRDGAEYVAVIGAGASGLTAALNQARLGRRVTLFEHMDRAGAKLSVTGNGKCNFTNAYLEAGCFHEPQGSRLGEFLDRFSASDAVAFMRSLGIGTAEKEGYFYPDTFRADTVRDALLSACISQGVQIRYMCGETDINELRDIYDRVIIACGSRAHKETGSNGSGYKLLEKLGIPYTRILPALCSVRCEDNAFFRENKGKRAIAAVSIGSHCAAGELQITEYGLSGIPVFNISRYASRLLDMGEEVRIRVDLKPDENDVPQIIRNRRNMNSSQQMTVTDETPVTCDFRIIRTASFDRSQVCTGGVSLDDLTDDFEVRSVPGVYVVGEMCDVDGICGGYNLHWAWLSGNLCSV